MPPASPFAIYIESVDISADVVYNTVRKVDNLNQQVDNLEFVMRKYGSITTKPDVNQEIIFYINNVKVFGGVIVRVEEITNALEVIEYKVICNDYSQYLKRELVTERYTSMTAGDIIADLITNYTDGFTGVNVSTGPDITSISFNRLSVADSLQKLAKAIGYVWYVDYDRDIHFFAKNTELSPFNITDNSQNYIDNTLKIVEDLSQIRNSIIVQGAEIVSTATRTEIIVADGDNEQYKLANKFSELPDIEVDGTPVTVGTEFLDVDASFDVMWNFNEKYIRFTAGNVPTVGQEVTVEALYLYPVAVRVTSLASIIQYGTYEFAITDKSIRSQDEATARAQAELDSYKNEIYDGGFSTHEDGLRSGQVIRITSARRERDISVLIQNVTMVMYDAEGLLLEYQVSFATLENIGIIEFLQNQLRSKEVIVDDFETLLSLVDLSDTAEFSDTIDTPTSDSPPYVYGPDAGNVGQYNYATWS